MISLFIIIAALTTVLSTRLSSEHIGTILRNAQSNDLYLNIIQSENHYLTGKDADIKKLPVTRFAFELATNIKPYDIRSFLGNEIPGFFAYDTQIYKAGEGTDFTNLPFESAPPMEELLKEREIAQEMLEDEQNDSTESVPPPERTIEENLVYIYQSHSFESFLPLLKDVSNPNDATSNDERVNVIAVGRMLKEALGNKGITAEQDTTNVTKGLHARKWNVINSYQFSRETVQEAVASNNDMKYLIDIHRDSQRGVITTLEKGGKKYARLFFVVGIENKNYRENLDFAYKLDAELEKRIPGISRGVYKKSKSDGDGRYNQDLSNRAILLEVGGVDNNLEELRNSVEVFADVYSEFIWNEKDAGEF